ncbi:MAG: TspO/MBR family protein [Balneolaceae bacterium]
MTAKRIHWPKLLGSIVGILLLGSLAGIANSGNITTWYTALQKPPFTPPGWVFAPAWTLLYTLMGVSLYLVLQSAGSQLRTKALAVFMVQLALNLAWSFIFFYFRQPALAFLEILLLLGFSIWMILLFYRVNPIAAWLQIPYIVWVTFAVVLNGTIVYLN